MRYIYIYIYIYNPVLLALLKGWNLVDLRMSKREEKECTKHSIKTDVVQVVRM
jgi:hypothetical protein